MKERKAEGVDLKKENGHPTEGKDACNIDRENVRKWERPGKRVRIEATRTNALPTWKLQDTRRWRGNMKRGDPPYYGDYQKGPIEKDPSMTRQGLPRQRRSLHQTP